MAVFDLGRLLLVLSEEQVEFIIVGGLLQPSKARPYSLRMSTSSTRLKTEMWSGSSAHCPVSMPWRAGIHETFLSGNAIS